MFTHPVSLVILGLFVGFFSGTIGLGGGAVMIPAMVLLLGMPQQMAQGPSLAVMIPPVALGAVIRYYNQINPDGSRNVHLWYALWISFGVAISTYLGAQVANVLPEKTLG